MDQTSESSFVQSETEAVKSPCVRVCRFDSAGFCLGCMRTVDEVRAWFRCTEAEKRALIGTLESRRKA